MCSINFTDILHVPCHALPCLAVLCCAVPCLAMSCRSDVAYHKSSFAFNYLVLFSVYLGLCCRLSIATAALILLFDVLCCAVLCCAVLVLVL